MKESMKEWEVTIVRQSTGSVIRLKIVALDGPGAEAIATRKMCQPAFKPSMKAGRLVRQWKVDGVVPFDCGELVRNP